MSAISSLTKK